jgi:hypothetical protein
LFRAADIAKLTGTQQPSEVAMRLVLLVLALLSSVAAAGAQAPCGALPASPPPAGAPELFAPGWINQGPRTRDIAMTPDMREIYFCVMVGGYRHSTIAVTRRGEDGCWSEPEVPALFADPRWRHLEPHVTPAGDRLFFVSDRPDDGDEPTVESIWLAEREGDRWRRPHRLPAPINGEAASFFPSVTRDGQLYFTRRLPEGRREVIMRARPDGQGGWLAPEELPAQVNAAPSQFNAFIDPDARFLLLSLAGHPDNLGQVDYWISFHDPGSDTWRGPVNLGPAVNGPGREGWSPYVSPDGRWFFFMSAASAGEPAAPLTMAALRALHRSPGNGLGHVWWMPAAFLEGLEGRAGG